MTLIHLRTRATCPAHHANPTNMCVASYDASDAPPPCDRTALHTRFRPTLAPLAFPFTIPAAHLFPVIPTSHSRCPCCGSYALSMPADIPPPLPGGDPSLTHPPRCAQFNSAEISYITGRVAGARLLINSFTSPLPTPSFAFYASSSSIQPPGFVLHRSLFSVTPRSSVSRDFIAAW